MKLALVSMIIGLLSIRFFPSLPSASFCLYTGLLGIILICWRTYPLGFLLMGIAWGCFCALQVVDNRLTKELDGKTIWVEGRIVGLPEQSEKVIRFYLKNAKAESVELPSMIRLSWYQGEPVMTGEYWRLLVRLKYPRGTVNPYTFDYEAWLTAKHIGATGVVKEAKRIASANHIATWRYKLRATLLDQDAAGQIGGLIALVLGDGSGLSQMDWRVLQETGTIHLMVISGQHITLLATFVYLCIVWLARKQWWPKGIASLPIACGLSIGVAIAYGVLAGFDVPVQRACIMLALVLVWRLRFRYLGIVTPFLVALATVLIYDPLVSLHAGFWLSFVSVAVLLLAFSGRLRRSSWWFNALKIEWIITLGLAPVLLALLLPISLSAPIANLIAVPIVSFLIVPLALLGTLFITIPYMGSSLLWLAGVFLKYLFVLLTFIAQLVPSWIAPMAPWWAFLLAFLGVVLLLLPRGVPFKFFGLVFCLPLLIPHQPTVSNGYAKIIIFDVGQGLSVLVRTLNHTLMYDVGPRFGDFNLGDRVIAPSLRRQGITKLDKVIVSHADIDHAGGLSPISEQLAIQEIISGEPHKLPTHLAAKPCFSGDQWVWDGVRFSLWQWTEAKKGNDASCVLLVEARGEKLLLTGDISASAEKAWLISNKQPINWLLAPHHGSNNSSSKQFLAQTKPNQVIFSRGWLNAFHHPSPLVLNRYKTISAEVNDTAVSGALQINLGSYAPATRQRDKKYFWRK